MLMNSNSSQSKLQFTLKLSSSRQATRQVTVQRWEKKKRKPSPARFFATLSIPSSLASFSPWSLRRRLSHLLSRFPPPISVLVQIGVQRRKIGVVVAAASSAASPDELHAPGRYLQGPAPPRPLADVGLTTKDV